MATLVAVSIQDLRPSSQDISAFYLANIYQLLADSNGSHVLIPAVLPDPSTPFSPPKYAVWVNSLWFLSLVISLTCALLATLLQQWARRYMKVTQPRYNPHKRVQIRAFFAEGVENLHLPWAVEALPILLHLSLSLFFGGLAIYLFNINHTVFKVVISWLGICSCLYLCITFMPIFRHDSPYYAPLSSSAWFLYSGTLSLVFRIFPWVVWRNYFAQHINYSTWEYVNNLRRTYGRWALQGITKTAEETVGTVSSEMVGRALKWTFESLYEDDELERFFASIPGFCGSKVFDDPHRSLAQLDSWTSAQALEVFLDHSWSSNLVSETVKQRRLVICVKAADAARLYFASEWILRRVFSGNFRGVLESVEMGRALISHSTDIEMGICAQSIVASIIASVRKRDSGWFALAMDQLGVSENVLRDYVSYGDSVLLANLIHIARQIFLSANRDLVPQTHNVLRSVSQFDVRNALPELQHNFCALWNEIVLEVQNNGTYFTPLLILVHTRHIYAALHQGSDSSPTVASLASIDDSDAILYQPFSYPLCNYSCHQSLPSTPSNIHGLVDSKMAETVHAPAIPSPADLHCGADGTATTTKLSHSNVSFHVIPSPRPPLKNYDLGNATACATQGIDGTSTPSTTNPVPPFRSRNAPSPRCSEETAIIPSSIAPDAALSSIPIPARRSAVPVELYPPADVVETKFNDPLQRPSSFPDSASPPNAIFSPQVTTSTLDQDFSESIGCLDVRDNTRNAKSPIPMEVARQPRRSSDIAANTAATLRP